MPGRGFGTAIASAGLRCGFVELGLQQIWAEAVAANTASVAILRRIGMRPAGLGEAASFLGQDSQYRRFAMSRAQWLDGGSDIGAD